MGELRQHDGVVMELVVLRQSFATLNGGGGVGGGGLRQGQGVPLTCTFPLNIGMEGAGFLPSIGALAKVGGKKSHHFPSPPIVIPPF